MSNYEQPNYGANNHQNNSTPMRYEKRELGGGSKEEKKFTGPSAFKEMGHTLEMLSKNSRMGEMSALSEQSLAETKYSGFKAAGFLVFAFPVATLIMPAVGVLIWFFAGAEFFYLSHLLLIMLMANLYIWPAYVVYHAREFVVSAPTKRFYQSMIGALRLMEVAVLSLAPISFYLQIKYSQTLAGWMADAVMFAGKIVKSLYPLASTLRTEEIYVVSVQQTAYASAVGFAIYAFVAFLSYRQGLRKQRRWRLTMMKISERNINVAKGILNGEV